MNTFEPYEGLKSFVYVCGEGETIEVVSKKFNMPISLISKLNGLSELCFGDEVVIIRGEYVAHRVVAGETLLSISKAYDKTVDELAKTNGVEVAYPGQILFI